VTEYSEHVLHESSTTWTKFNKLQGLWRSDFLVLGEAPNRDKLTKNLSDLWGGDEVALLAENVARHVVAALRARQNLLHVRRN
jgi:hypothetical protein